MLTHQWVDNSVKYLIEYVWFLGFCYVNAKLRTKGKAVKFRRGSATVTGKLIRIKPLSKKVDGKA